MAISETTTGVKTSTRGSFLRALLYGRNRVNNNEKTTIDIVNFVSGNSLLQISKIFKFFS